MNKILEASHAGTLESSDAFVRVMPIEEEGVVIEIESTVCEIYGDAIRTLVAQTIGAMQVDKIKVIVQDKGALEYVIKARVQTAILRALGTKNPDWSSLA